MIINGQYIPVSGEELSGTQSTSNKSLIDYINESSDSSTSSGSKYFSDSVTLSPEAYAAIKEYKPEMLEALGYSEDTEETLTSSSSGSSLLDSVSLSEEAYAALKETNPELLTALGYEVSDTDSTED